MSSSFIQRYNKYLIENDLNKIRSIPMVDGKSIIEFDRDIHYLSLGYITQYLESIDCATNDNIGIGRRIVTDKMDRMREVIIFDNIYYFELPPKYRNVHYIYVMDGNIINDWKYGCKCIRVVGDTLPNTLDQPERYSIPFVGRKCTSLYDIDIRI